MGTADTPALLRIEEVLGELARRVSGAQNLPAATAGPASAPDQPLGDFSAANAQTRRIATATAWIRARAARDRALGADLFSDPAWAMMLDLYVNGEAQSGLAVSSLSGAANVPLTTGTRWIALLEKAGFVRRCGDTFDRRRTLISLTEEGVRKIGLALDRAG